GRGAAAQRANGAACEKVVRTQTRYGIAREQKNQPFADSPKSGRTARPHRDAMNRELAMLCDESGREILDADARTTRDDDHVRLGEDRLQDGVGFIGDQAGEIDDATITFGKGREHGTVGVRDSITFRPPARGQELVAGYHQPHARLSENWYL